MTVPDNPTYISAVRRLAESEKSWQTWVVDRARLSRWDVYHTFDSRRSEAGWPDLALVRPPRFILAELKTETGRLSPAQRQWRRKLLRCPGIETYLWRPSDRDDITEILAEVTRWHPSAGSAR